MDILILLGSLFILFALGVPIAYSLGLAAIAGSMWIGVPLEAVMLKISDGVSKVAMLTILVPPSHNAVIYSLATGGLISITSLFMAGVVPGLLLGAALIGLVIFIGYRDGHPRGESVPMGAAVRITFDALWGLITIFIIIGGILLGIFTAIEAGAIATLWAFFVTMFIYRDYRWRDLPTLVHRTLKTVAMVMTLIACASSFGYVMALMQIPAKVTAFFLTLSHNKEVILMLLNG